jgi:hypothetical protein
MVPELTRQATLASKQSSLDTDVVILYREIMTSHETKIKITSENQPSLIAQLIQVEDNKITQLDDDIDRLQAKLTNLEHELQPLESV